MKYFNKEAAYLSEAKTHIKIASNFNSTKMIDVVSKRGEELKKAWKAAITTGQKKSVRDAADKSLKQMDHMKDMSVRRAKTIKDVAKAKIAKKNARTLEAIRPHIELDYKNLVGA